MNREGLARLFDLCWELNDALRITSASSVEFLGSQNMIEDFRALLHELDPDFRGSEHSYFASPTPPEQEVAQPKFLRTYCSNCGREFGPGDHGFSHCENHAHLRSVSDKSESQVIDAYLADSTPFDEAVLNKYIQSWPEYADQLRACSFIQLTSKPATQAEIDAEDASPPAKVGNEVESRSVLRRKAAQRGEPVPEFEAAKVEPSMESLVNEFAHSAANTALSAYREDSDEIIEEDRQAFESARTALLTAYASLGGDGKDGQDAERYRWIREGRTILMPEKKSGYPSIPWCVRIELDHGVPMSVPCCNTTLDAAIDQAIAAERGK